MGDSDASVEFFSYLKGSLESPLWTQLLLNRRPSKSCSRSHLRKGAELSWYVERLGRFTHEHKTSLTVTVTML